MRDGLAALGERLKRLRGGHERDPLEELLVACLDPEADELDLLMEVVADENPEVLAEYESLRKVSYRRRKKPVEPEEADPTVATATVKVVDATNGEPIVGATLALDDQPVNDVTDEYGEIDLDNLTLTQHEFTATADGYQAATLQGATTTGGEDYVFELGLEPGGAG